MNQAEIDVMAWLYDKLVERPRCVDADNLKNHNQLWHRLRYSCDHKLPDGQEAEKIPGVLRSSGYPTMFVCSLCRIYLF
jgi:hypothetical protein